MLTVTLFGNKFPPMGIMLKYGRFRKTNAFSGISSTDGTASANSFETRNFVR